MDKKDHSLTLKSDTLMLAYLCVKDEDGLINRVAILDRFGISDNEIATVCNVAVQSVRDARLKRKRVKHKKTRTIRQPNL